MWAKKTRKNFFQSLVVSSSIKGNSSSWQIVSKLSFWDGSKFSVASETLCERFFNRWISTDSGALHRTEFKMILYFFPNLWVHLERLFEQKLHPKQQINLVQSGHWPTQAFCSKFSSFFQLNYFRNFRINRHFFSKLRTVFNFVGFLHGR